MGKPMQLPWTGGVKNWYILSPGRAPPGGNPLGGLQIPKSFRGVTVVANHSNRSQF
jgi:hypothetical protein